MGKLIKIICGLFFILCCTNLYAEPKLKRESPEVTPYEEGRLYWMEMPVICGKAETVKRYIDEHDFVLVYVGVGKRGGSNEGQPIYLVSEFVTADMKQSLSVVTTLSFTESCIMYRGFDLQFKNSPMTKGTPGKEYKGYTLVKTELMNLTLKDR
jgi:hypothetical protein|tara:strand:+ start:39 stop:500 length:462 start_codon:yes stop_codon:yes gene_type:complete